MGISALKKVKFVFVLLFILKSLWRVNDDPMEFIKITLHIPKENELNSKIVIIVTHTPLAI
jgi:hypothetical protein